VIEALERMPSWEDFPYEYRDKGGEFWEPMREIYDLVYELQDGMLFHDDTTALKTAQAECQRQSVRC
jgi:hypothetical protein